MLQASKFNFPIQYRTVARIFFGGGSYNFLPGFFLVYCGGLFLLCHIFCFEEFPSRCSKTLRYPSLDFPLFHPLPYRHKKIGMQNLACSFSDLDYSNQLPIILFILILFLKFKKHEHFLIIIKHII